MTDNLAWVDIETTGLDLERDRILEIGIVITTRAPSFEVLAQMNVVLPHAGNLINIRDYSQVVVDMHNENNLWEECHKEWRNVMHVPDYPKMDDREAAMTFFMKEWDADGSPMCGSSPHFDRSFITRDFPKLAKMFHYRNFDVSTLNQLAGMIDPNWESIKNEIHRALPDLQDSIATARKYVSRYFSIHATYDKGVTSDPALFDWPGDG